jgi:hypothetical protein
MLCATKISCFASLRSLHDDMSAKPYNNCNMIMVNYVDLWLMHSQVASQLKGAKLELRELKARFMLLGACTSCSLLRSDFEASAIGNKDLKHKLDHFFSLQYFIPCVRDVWFSQR